MKANILRKRLNLEKMSKTPHMRETHALIQVSKQTRSFYERIEIKTLVILRMLFAYMSPETSNQYIVFCYSEQFIANFIPCFLQFSFGLLCVRLCSFLKMNVTFLRRCCLIWKRKQHTFGTFGQIKWITSKQIKLTRSPSSQAFEVLSQV